MDVLFFGHVFKTSSMSVSSAPGYFFYIRHLRSSHIPPHFPNWHLIQANKSPWRFLIHPWAESINGLTHTHTQSRHITKHLSEPIQTVRGICLFAILLEKTASSISIIGTISQTPWVAWIGVPVSLCVCMRCVYTVCVYGVLSRYRNFLFVC